VKKNLTNILFITGTDTGVGKTVVTALLTNCLVRAGVEVSVVKPIETGCKSEGDQLVGSDEQILFLALAGSQQKVPVVLTKFKTPVAPQVAEVLEDKPIDLDFIRGQILEASKSSKLLIVEGAGGLLVPICSGYTYAELIADCGMTTLTVVGSRLGALNHGALTMEVLANRKLNSLGYVLNDLFSLEADNSEARLTNRKMLSEISEKYNQKEVAFLPALSKDLETYLKADAWSDELSAVTQMAETVKKYFSI
jgi:dethiobiotin synthetase